VKSKVYFIGVFHRHPSNRIANEAAVMQSSGSIMRTTGRRSHIIRCLFTLCLAVFLAAGCRRDLVSKGIEAVEKGRIQQAETYFRQAAESNPTDADAQANLSIVLLKAGQTNAALAAFQRTADLAPDDPRPFEFMGDISSAAGQWKSAAAFLAEAVRRNPRSPQALNALAVAELQTVGPQAARARLTQALDIAPNFSPALFNLALLNRDWLKNPTEAQKLFRRYIKVSRDTERIALARAALSDLAAGPPAPAPLATAPAKGESVVRRPQAATEAYNRGVRRHSAGDLDRAIQDYTRAVQNDPTMAMAHYNMAMIFKGRTQLSKARASLEQALAQDPAFSDARYMLAIVLRDQKDNAAAIAELVRLTERTPLYAPAHHALGLLYKDTARLDLAKREFTRYLELAPNGPSARDARAWLQTLH
jgi:tetratricopeptide (TPR) repeat protein